MKIIYLKDEYILVNENGRIVKKEYGYEKGIVTSSLKYKHIININFKLPKNIEKEMLESEAEKYIFTQGSLDYTKEYKIIYKFKEYEDFYNVEAFVADIEILKNLFEKHLKTFKYIDFISAAPFVFESFYEISGVLPQNDMFIFLSDDEAFVSCFENGEFLFVKSITKLSNLARNLGVEKNELLDILKTRGLNEEKYENKDIFHIVEAFFSELFMKVSHLINYSVNNYRLNGINHIYFYSPYKIEGLIEKYEDFWNLSGIKFKKYSLNTEYDPFDYTAIYYNSKHYENFDENFSPFLRPLPFYKTKTGQLFIFILSLTVLLGIDIGYKKLRIDSQEQKIKELTQKIKREERISKMLNIAVKKYSKKIKEIKSKEILIQNEIEKISALINTLYEIQHKKPFCDVLADVTNLLAKYNLKLVSFEKDENHIKLVISTDFTNSSSVAKFMKSLIALGYKNVFSKEIYKEKNIYVAEVSYDE